MEQIFVTFLVVFALFFANSTTVLVALVAKPLVLPTQWSHLQKIVHKPLESDLNFSKTLLQCSNVTVSCVKYQFYFAHFPPGISNSIHSFSWQRDNMSKAKGTVEIHYSLSFLESMCKVELRSFFR